MAITLNEPLCIESIAPSDAILLDGVEAKLLTVPNNDELYVAWVYGEPDKHVQVKEFLRLRTWATNQYNQRWVDDPEIFGVVQSGRWRQSDITTFKNERLGGYVVMLHLKKGWADELYDDEAQIIKRVLSPGNDVDILNSVGTGITDTVSDDPEDFITIRYDNIASSSIAELSDELLTTSFDSPTIGDVPLTGTYHVVTVNHEMKDDGSGTLYALLARPQFTLRAYSDTNTKEAKRIGYLWNVPKTVAQDILDAWDEVGVSGRSASASYSEGSNLCSLILASDAAPGENLTTEWIPISEDIGHGNASGVWRRWSFGWSFTKAQTGTFITNHSTPIGTVEDGKAVMVRQMDVGNRGSYYDVTCVETSFGPKANSSIPDHVITIGPGSGTEIDRKDLYGWNLRREELPAITAYIESFRAVGVTIDFRLTRDQSDSFDYQASIVATKASMTATKAVTASAGGIASEVSNIVGITQADLASLALAANKLTDVQVDVTQRDDKLINAKVSKRTVLASEVQYGDANTTIIVGKNTDALPATPAGMKFKSGTLRPQDGGAYDYEFVYVPVGGVTESASTGPLGITETIDVARSADVGDLALLVASIPSDMRKRVQLDATIDEFGKINYAVKTLEVKETAALSFGSANKVVLVGKNASALPTAPVGMRFNAGQVNPQDDLSLDYQLEYVLDGGYTESGNTGTSGVSEALSVARGADIGDFQTVLNSIQSDIRKRVQIDANLDENGKVTYAIKSVEVKETSGISIGTANRTVIVGKNADALPTPPAGMRFNSGRISPQDDRSLDYELEYIVDGGFSDTGTTGTLGVFETINIARGVDIGALQTMLNSTPSDIRKRVQVDANLDENGKVTYAVKSTEVQETAALTYGDANKTIITGKNADGLPATPAGMKFAGGSVRPQDDGTLDFEFEYVPVGGTVESATTGPLGITESLNVARAADVGDLSLLLAGIPSDVRNRVQIDASIDQFGKVNYAVKSTEVKETAGLTIGNAVKDIIIGKNATSLPATPAGKRFVGGTVRPQDDGSFDYELEYIDDGGFTATGTTGVGGITETIAIARGAEISDLATILASIPSAIRTRVQVDASLDDMGKLNYSIKSLTVKATNTSYGTVQKIVLVGKNSDAIPAAPTGYRFVNGQVRPQDDGSLDYDMEFVPVAAISDSANTGTLGVTESIAVARYADIGDLATAMSAFPSGIRSRVQMDAALDEQGNVSYSIRSVGVQETLLDYGDTQTKVLVGKNATVLPAAPVGMKFRAGSVRPQDGGSLDYELEYVPLAGNVDTANSGTLGVIESLCVARYADIGDLATKMLSFPSGINKRTQLDANIDQFGKVNYSIKTIEVQSPTASTTDGTSSETITTKYLKNIDPSVIPTDYVVPGRRVIYNVNLNDSGSADATKRVIVKNKLVAQSVFGTDGSITTVDIATGDTNDPPLVAAPAVGTQVATQILINDDDTKNWSQSTTVNSPRASSSFVLASLLPQMDKYGYTKDARSFKHRLTPLAAAGPYFYYESLVQKEDMTFDGVIVDLNYVLTPAYIAFLVSSPVNWEVHEFKYEMLKGTTKINMVQTKIIYKYTLYIGDSFSNAILNLNASLPGDFTVDTSGPSQMEIAGYPLWTSIRKDRVGIGLPEAYVPVSSAPLISTIVD